MHRGDIDDSAIPRCGHTRQSVSHRVKRCRQVDGDDVIPYVDGDICEGRRVLYPRVVDQNVQVAPREHLSHQSVDLSDVAQIRTEVSDLRTARSVQFRNQLSRFIRVGKSVCRDPDAFGGERERDTFADTPLSAGHQHGFILELCHNDSIGVCNAAIAQPKTLSAGGMSSHNLRNAA